MNPLTGEIPLPENEELNKVIVKRTIRANGSLREQQDFSNCPTLAEQHTAHLTNINYLMKKYKPDELASYIAARSQYRQELLGHDFSSEPSKQDALNVIYKSKEEFKKLPNEVRSQFSNHVEFLKFIDNPSNVQKMLKLGILTKRQIDAVSIPDAPAPAITIPPKAPA